ncbi:MAG: antibiotic biosynthesis monooxygenase [Candidatus Methanoperedens sp.]|nr:antibiotic biosynthesis monooxygenase [Candidatus Methanoperedens sp.]MCZ7359006.1 antibiotic biosynthesis monooxygenase [Candidatus Methanoperedens sp.]HLB71830.1 antibiotic biosynthesis monooxygenase family protein [Candidatus Methanoperedens sp.]
MSGAVNDKGNGKQIIFKKGANMEVITIVEGRVPISKAKEFETAYAALKQGALSPGLIRSSLLRNSDNPEIYRIETIWESREALEKMRSSTQIPKAIELFQKVRASPRLEIYDIVHNLP